MPAAVNGKKICTKCRIEKPVSEFYPAKSNLDGRRNRCKACGLADNIAYRGEHQEKEFDRKARWRRKNHERHLENTAAWARTNRKEDLARKISYRKEHPEKWAAYKARRNADKARATPKWMTEELHRETERFYQTASILTKITGLQFEVDHIVPVHGKTVRGLHVPWNLQVLTREENRRKWNKVAGPFGGMVG